MGTPTPELILDAASRVAPVETIELYIVLANVKAMAACAYPDQQTVFTGRHETDAALVDFTAHECCHAIAQTAEEYQDCNGPTTRTYLNQATEAERLAKSVWWKSLAKKGELQVGTGSFKAEHLYGDPDVHFTATRHTPVFDRLTRRNGMLGLYWGCQDIDPSLPGPCDFYEDGRGRHYYRPMAECRMRDEKSPYFCRVCSHLMTERIRAAAL